MRMGELFIDFELLQEFFRLLFRLSVFKYCCFDLLAFTSHVSISCLLDALLESSSILADWSSLIGCSSGSCKLSEGFAFSGEAWDGLSKSSYSFEEYTSFGLVIGVFVYFTWVTGWLSFSIWVVGGTVVFDIDITVFDVSFISFMPDMHVF